MYGINELYIKQRERKDLLNLSRSLFVGCLSKSTFRDEDMPCCLTYAGHYCKR